MQLSLYSIAEQYREAFQQLSTVLDESGEFDAPAQQQIIEDSLSTLVDDFKSKAMNVAAFINNLKLELEAIKIAENRMTKRRSGLESKIQFLSDYLFTQCQKTGFTTLKNDELVLAIKTNPPKVIIDNENAIPKTYKEVVKSVKILKSAIATALKSGMSVKGAHLEASQRLDIR